jgi:hypothetical protein
MHSGARGDGGFRNLARFIGLALEEARDEIVSYVSVVPLLGFLATVVYLGLFSMIEPFAEAHPGQLNAWTMLAFSLCHYLIAFSLSPLRDPALRAFSDCAGLRGRESSGLQRAWFIARNWHVPLVDVLLALPVAAAGPNSSAAIAAFAAYGPASLWGFGSLAFAARSRAGAPRGGAASPGTRPGKPRRRAAPAIAALAKSILASGEAVALVAAAAAIELAGAADLLAHPSPNGDAGRWLMLLAFCAAILSQAALCAAYRVPKRYFRMLPVSYAAYSVQVLVPVLATFAVALSPLLLRVAARFPERLPGALLFLAGFSIVPLALAENRGASRPAAALLLFFCGAAAAALAAVLPIAAYALASVAIAAAIPYGRRHFLFDEVLE